MTKVRGLAALSKGAPFSRFDFDRRELGTNDVKIDIAFAGICHSCLLYTSPSPRD